jgi:predicted permease
MMQKIGRRRSRPGVEGVPMANRWGTGRIEAFSDGVFAIAITLLVLDIRVPLTEFDNLWHGIANQWPAYLGYATSFLTIGGLWLAHHGVFRRLAYANDQVNAILLATTPNIGFYVGVIVLAVFAPRVAAFGFLVIAIAAVLRERGDEPAPPAAEPA